MSFIPSQFPSASTDNLLNNDSTDNSTSAVLLNDFKSFYNEKLKSFPKEFFNFGHFTKPINSIQSLNSLTTFLITMSTIFSSRVLPNFKYFYYNYLVLTLFGLIIYTFSVGKIALFFSFLFIILYFGILMKFLYSNGESDEFTIYRTNFSIHKKSFIFFGIIVVAPLIIVSGPVQIIWDTLFVALFIVLPHGVFYDPVYHSTIESQQV
ncbi:uncharacterized protein SCODWIG_00115 [Saccharomycodes ludwigii]|uniref:PRA1 family protein n=1 Tax=Saccharomycodes ludwigii TaxID=36035 RepID=A0A376B1J6_9ASCO|nr:hypothetical protein SCDLUD_004172 [Saccharomycodes ludwigii]KAH3899873.1 hypothetical protein SCDLUD_004172 [Saccharomycodes ludwigii]SSD58354.1 uncharacterized protein SCODWIG_00115 [Saccharomycodes ludwigii]